DAGFTTKRRHGRRKEECPLWANSGHGARLFDQLVGAADECWRDRKSKNPGSLKVDSQLELGWQLNWKFVRLCAPEYAVNVGSCAIKQIGQNDSIRYQAAVSDKEAKRIDSGQTEASGE